MEPKLLLAKCLTLLFRESQLVDKTENSADLVRTVLENIQVSEIGIGLNSDREVIMALKMTILEMCSLPQDHIYDKNDLLQRIRINCANDEKLYDAVKQGIEDDMIDGALKRSVVNIRKSINNHFKEQSITEILNRASLMFKFNRDKIKDVNQFITELVGQLEPLQISNTSKDPAVLNDIDIGNDESMQEIFAQIHKRSTGDLVYKTGWKELNDMLQGGFRPGECWITPALQHKYKTGANLTLFKQIALYNNPQQFLKDPTKKPLLLRISCEDDLELNLQFLYQSLKYDETRVYVDVKNVSVEEMSCYVKTRLQVNGWHIKMIRVDPTQWTYKSFCNKIIELEAQGYEVLVALMDYLAMIPTIGCVNTGPMGTDVRDLFRRIRNFCSPKRILFVTPHQLSTEAKQLIRQGMPESEFVKEIAEKGFFAGSKQLDQEVDGELYIHLFKHAKETWLSFMRGKHRIPTILPDELKYFVMKFPRGMPIPDNRTNDQGELVGEGYRKLPNIVSNTSEDLFKLG